ncbi:hypothetical protein ACFW7J_21120 [Streptomyces sp. NPDC059525]
MYRVYPLSPSQSPSAQSVLSVNYSYVGSARFPKALVDIGRGSVKSVMTK